MTIDIPLCGAHEHLRVGSGHIPRERHEDHVRAVAYQCPNCRAAAAADKHAQDDFEEST